MTLTGSWLAADAAFAGQFASESSLSSGSISESGGSSSSISESGSSGSSSGPPAVLHVTADSTLRQDSPNTNEGANPRIRVSGSPIRRGIVQFDPQTLFDVQQEADWYGGVSIYLTLHIAWNGNDWGQSDDHYVDVHPLPPGMYVAEGNGKFSGLPSGDTTRGNGAGVTWNVPHDVNTADQKKTKAKNVPRLEWQGGSNVMGPATASVLHVNGLSGQVSWDVTNDVRTGVSAWIVKVRDERGSEQFPNRRKLGHDPFRGSVDYYSKEGAAEEIGCVFPPQLQIVTFNQCGGGEASQSSQLVKQGT